MVHINSIRQRKDEALAMTYGYFLGHGGDEDDRTQIAMRYADDTLSQEERKEITSLIEKNKEARQYYLARFLYSTRLESHQGKFL